MLVAFEQVCSLSLIVLSGELPQCLALLIADRVSPSILEAMLGGRMII